MINYFKGIISEFRHVVWPSRRTALLYTFLVIVVSFAVAYYLGLFDWIFGLLLENFIV